VISWWGPWADVLTVLAGVVLLFIADRCTRDIEHNRKTQVRKARGEDR
jgi:hypothetical protein